MKYIIDNAGVRYLGVLVSEENLHEIIKFLSIRNTEVAFNNKIILNDNKLTYSFNKPVFGICTNISMRIGDYISLYEHANNDYEYFPIGVSEIEEGLYTVTEPGGELEDFVHYIKKYS